MQAPAAALASLYGLARSARVYRLDPWRRRRMRRLYAGLIRPGDLCFDLGAHLGDRSLAFLALGARVVAVEPQPLFAKALRHLARRRPGLTVVEAAVDRVPGKVELWVSRATPTVSSGDPGFLAAVQAVPSFAWVRWDARVSVPAITLDQLIHTHGLPDFVKLDVEGMEGRALAGLARPVPALSFEVVPAHDKAAQACLARLGQLGAYRCRFSYGESGAFADPDWCSLEQMAARLAAMPADGPSGDVYAKLGPGR